MQFVQAACAGCVLTLAPRAAARAQSVALDELRYEIRTDARTMHSLERGLPARATPGGAVIPIDSLVVTPAGRTIWGHVDQLPYLGIIGIHRRNDGAVDSVAVIIREHASYVPGVLAGTDATRDLLVPRWRNIVQAVAHATLFTGPATPRGVPTSFVAIVGDDTVRVDGVTRGARLADSVANGITLQRFRDSTTLELVTSTLMPEPTLHGIRRDTRRRLGTIVGVRVFDSTRTMTIAAYDTMRSRGIESRRLPDGRMLTDSITQETARTVLLTDVRQRHARDVASSTRFGVGMVRRPALGETPEPDALIPAVRDSLVARYRAASAAERDTILRAINFLYNTGMRERLARIHAEQGDTVGALRLLTLDIYTPLSEWAYRLVRPLLDDPERALQLGIDSGDLFENVHYAFRNYPFAARGDEMAWCPRDVCAIVARERTTAHDPRLRAMGLMAAYRYDPAIYADTVVADTSGLLTLPLLRDEARGLHRNQPSDSGIVMPSRDAPWTEWYRWMRGATDDVIAQRVQGKRPSPPLTGPDPIAELGLAPSTRVLRMAELRRGERFAETFQAQYRSATNDTARIVYYALLGALGQSVPFTGNIVEGLQSTNTFDRMRANGALSALKFERASASVARDVERALFDIVLDSAPVWPLLAPTIPRSFGIRPGRLRSSDHIIADSLQPETAARLRAAGISVHARGWRLPNEASGNEITVGPIMQSGDFVEIQYGRADLVRLANGAGGGNATGGTILLVRTGGVWTLVSMTFWVT